MKFWKQIPNATRIYLIIFVYLIVLLVGLILVRQWRLAPDFFTFQLPFGDAKQKEQSTQTAEAIKNAATPTFAQDKAWLRAKTNLRVYAGPGEEYPGVAWLEDNQTAEIIGKDLSEKWWSINLPYLQQGSCWVLSEQVEAANTSSVPVVNVESETVQPAATLQDYPAPRRLPILIFAVVQICAIRKLALLRSMRPQKLWRSVQIIIGT